MTTPALVLGPATHVIEAVPASLGRARPRIVYIIQGFSLPYYPAYRRLPMLAGERLLSPFTDTVIAVSHDERRAYLTANPISPERISVVWNSVDVTPFCDAERNRHVWRSELRLPDDAVVITTICRLYKPRDVETILRAFASLVGTDPPTYLLVVGDGPDRPHIEALRDRLGLGSRVILTGQRNDIPDVMAASDIFTLTTWGWEGLPFTVLEAMASARPVVATRAGGIPEAVVEGETGLLVPRRDVPALSDAYACLIADASLRSRMGAAGRERARSMFSQKRMIELTSAVYDRLVSQAGREKDIQVDADQHERS